MRRQFSFNRQFRKRWFMSKELYIAEKPSVAAEFAKALHLNVKRYQGYMESDYAVVTWCVGHLVTMSYPERYDERLKKWSLDTLPFIPDQFLYEVIPSVKKQFTVVSKLLNRDDVTCIYVCTDSGREGEYIYRLVEQMSGVKGKKRKRVWIDSQTEDEIKRGIAEAKDLSAYDSLSDAAYLRAKEDYLMGINFSRLLTLKYGQTLSAFLRSERGTVVSVGRVMTCVLGMVVRREREIRDFVKTPFYRVLLLAGDKQSVFEAEFRAVEQSRWYQSKAMYKDSGFLKREDAQQLIEQMMQPEETETGTSSAERTVLVEKVERRQEKKNPPLLYNLAELQNECSRLFKLSPDETLRVVQELYENKLVTYPRTDARVLSTAVAKELSKNLKGLVNFEPVSVFAAAVCKGFTPDKFCKSRYVNDSAITDHYAIIPTGQGLSNLRRLSEMSARVYETIARRFLSVFFPPAVYKKLSVTLMRNGERFFANVRVLEKPGYLKVYENATDRKREGAGDGTEHDVLPEQIAALKKGMVLPVQDFAIREGETSPPKRYNSGSMILAMENAGQLIEDEELRAQIKGSGIGTSATRAEILKKLVHIRYLSLNKKSQILKPTLSGELIYDVVYSSIRQLLNPDLTASWEKGLTYVADGAITEREYMEKLRKFIQDRTQMVLGLQNQSVIRESFDRVSPYYRKKQKE